MVPARSTTTTFSCLLMGLSASALIPSTSQESSVILLKCTSGREFKTPHFSQSVSRSCPWHMPRTLLSFSLGQSYSFFMSFSLEGFPVSLSRLSPFGLVHLRFPFITLTPLVIPVYFLPGFHTQVTGHQAAMERDWICAVGLQEGKLWGWWQPCKPTKWGQTWIKLGETKQVPCQLNLSGAQAGSRQPSMVPHLQPGPVLVCD